MKNKIILPGVIAVGILAIAIFAASPSFAQDTTTNTLVQRIAQRFNLSEDDVQAEFDSFHDQRRAERFAIFADRLDELVSDGKLTTEQKDAILEKHEEAQNKTESLKDLDPSERHDQMDAIHEEMKTFMENLGVDLPGMGPMLMKGKGGPGPHGEGYGLGFKKPE